MSRAARGLAAVLALVPLSGCARDPEGWLADLRSDEPFERRMAVVALGQVDARWADRAVPALVQAVVCDPDVDVRVDAYESLRRQAPNDLRALVDGLALERFPKVLRAPLLWILLEQGARAVPELERGVRERSGEARTLSALALGEAGELDRLSALAAEHELAIRLAAVAGLARAQAVQPSPEVRAALEALAHGPGASDDDRAVRDAALAALGGG